MEYKDYLREVMWSWIYTFSSTIISISLEKSKYDSYYLKFIQNDRVGTMPINPIISKNEYECDALLNHINEILF